MKTVTIVTVLLLTGIVKQTIQVAGKNDIRTLPA